MTVQRSTAPEERSGLPLFVLLALVVPVFGFGVGIAYNSGFGAVLKVSSWFDPLFFQYNVLLWSLFVLLIPLITFVYVQSMRDEREARLKSELREATWNKLEVYIKAVIRRQFGMQNYIGSTAILMVVVAMGLVVMFLLKPVAKSGLLGLDYSKGANLFLMGAWMGLEPGQNPDLYFDRVIISLTAFQFGFLGAYAYFIGHFVRSYFTMDLTPNTFVAMSIRMVTAGLVALVVSFALPILAGGGSGADSETFRALLPVVSFGIGFFPDWGLLAIQKVTRRALHFAREEKMASTSLAALSGMSYEHEVRLKRQGYDALENLAEANLIEMAVRTGFSYAQLRTWAGEAWLRVRFGAQDYESWVRLTGVRTADQFRAIFGESSGLQARSAAEAAFAASSAPMRVKVGCIARLVEDWHSPEVGAPSVSAATAS